MTKEDGIRLREARRARVRRIRARVVGGSVALFLAVWLLITVVLVTGHDPALARKTQTQTQAATAVTTTSDSRGATSAGSSSGATGSSSSTSSGATSSSTGSGSGGVSAVTSSQS
jgi:hypothetical protein